MAKLNAKLISYSDLTILTLRPLHAMILIKIGSFIMIWSKVALLW